MGGGQGAAGAAAPPAGHSETQWKYYFNLFKQLLTNALVSKCSWMHRSVMAQVRKKCAKFEGYLISTLLT